MITEEKLNLGHELLGDLQALAAEAATLVEQAASGKPTGEAVTTLRAQFEVAQAHFSDWCGEAKKMATESAKSTDRAVRENPYQTVALVGAVALVAGMLIGRATKSD